MCGIAGALVRHSNVSDISYLNAIGMRMVNSLTKRGPDDAGVWSEVSGVTLAHRRLSILDLSAAGHQPMISQSGRFVIVFNGEIYNHLDLRQRLLQDGEAILWRGHSDTETLLACLEAWGPAEVLKNLVGMFAFAVWDRQEKSLLLARDRFGEKPLYYGWNSKNFLFGSELKALTAHPQWSADIDRHALSSYLRLGYVPTPMSIWSGIKKLVPGTYVVISNDMMPHSKLPEPIEYWSLRECVSTPKVRSLDDFDATNKLETLLQQSIKSQMLADVPIGAFLSGGVDSSAVVAVMQSQSTRPVNTFTIGFAEKNYNEADHARAVAQHLGTDHTELFVTPNEMLELVERLPDIYDEPFSDSSQLPTHLVSLLTREHVTVALSGDGGDELFGGYNRYISGPKLWSGMQKVPLAIRSLCNTAIQKVSPQTLDNFSKSLPLKLQLPNFGDKVHKIGVLMSAKSADDFYRLVISLESNPHQLLDSHLQDFEPDRAWAESEIGKFGELDFAERMMFNDVIGYMTDDVLCKVDRAAMAASLEVRTPFLDIRVAEFALNLPIDQKIRDRTGKWLLRRVLDRYVPKALIERPKQGFGVPIDSWLRGPLRDWAEGLLDPARMRSEGIFNVDLVTERWQQHLSCQRNWHHWLWNVLMFQAWREPNRR
jgi:asparagine synthase (glutamine-hydrolysing)